MGSGTTMASPLLPAGVFCWSHPRVRARERAGVPHQRFCTNRCARSQLAYCPPADCRPHAPAPGSGMKRLAGPGPGVVAALRRGAGRLCRQRSSALAADTLSRPGKDPKDLVALHRVCVSSTDGLARTAGQLGTGGAAPCWTFAS